MVIALDPVTRAANEAAFQASFAPRPMAIPATPMPAVPGAPGNSYVPGPFDPTPVASIGPVAQADFNTGFGGEIGPVSNLLGIAGAGDLASRLITGQGIAQNLGLPNPIDAIRSIGGNALSNVQGWLSGSPAQTFPLAPGYHPILSPFTPAGQAAAAYPTELWVGAQNPSIGFLPSGSAAAPTMSGAGSASSAPFSSFGGPGMQGIGSSIASQAAAAGSIGGPAGFSANLAAGGLTPASGIGGTGGIAGSAGGGAGAGSGFLSGMGGLSATLPIALPATFVAGKVLARLAGADSTKPQKWMGMSGVRAYDPDFEGTLQDANRIAYLAAAPQIAGEYQRTEIPGEYQQRFGLPATVTPEMIRAATSTRLGGMIQREAEANRNLSRPEGYSG